MAITVEEALRLALAHTPLLEEEWVPLQQALGRTLSREVCASMVHPPFDRSPQDGYAVIAADTAEASSEQPAV